MEFIAHRRGSAQRLPLGEAVTKIGTPEPILVTDEGKTGTDFTDIYRFLLPG